MSVHRLGALLRHHSPQEAWQVVLGELPCTGLDRAGRRRQSGRAAPCGAGARRNARPQTIWAQCVALGLEVLPYGHARLSGRAARRSVAAARAVRAGRPQSARRSSGRHRRHPQRHRCGPRGGSLAGVRARRGGRARHLRAWPAASMATPTAGVAGGGGRGPADRHRRVRPRRGVPARASRPVGGSGRTAGCCSASRHPVCRPSRIASRCATASSPRCRRWWWWSSHASVAARSITAAQAIERDVPVDGGARARSEPARRAGTNALLCDGAAPVTGVDDVLDRAFAAERRGRRWWQPTCAPARAATTSRSIGCCTTTRARSTVSRWRWVSAWSRRR